MKQAWHPLAPVARSTTPCSIGSSSSDDDTSLITPYSVWFSSRSPRSSTVSGRRCSADRAMSGGCPLDAAAVMWSMHMPSGSSGVDPAIVQHPRRGIYLHPMKDAPRDSDDVRKIVKDNGIEFLFAQFVDMHGKPSAKLVPAHHLDDLLVEGAGFAGFAAGDIGQGPHDPDLIAIPDPRSFTILPWQPNVARFACDITVEGEPWPYCPRTILRGMLDRVRAESGYE